MSPVCRGTDRNTLPCRSHCVEVPAAGSGGRPQVAVFRAQYCGDAFDAASACGVPKPGAMAASVPGSISWWSMLSSRSQLCWPIVKAMKQPSSTSSGSEKWR